VHGLKVVRSEFPETGRNVEWLPWLVERGGARAREFWCAASRDDRVVTRGARRMALEESLSRRASPDPAMGRVSWERLRVRLRTRRPVLAQFVESIRHELAAPIGDVLAAVHGAIEGEESEITAIDDVIVLSTLMLLLATDATGRAGASDRRPVETLTAWVADSAALGVADLLLAEVFEAFAELQTRWSTALSRAFASAFGDEAVRASRRTGGRREAVLGRWKRALVSAVSSRSTAVVRLR
jgi:hypothetical protein